MDELERRRLFADAVAVADGEIDLARAALLIAQDEYPDLDPPRWLDDLDALAATARTRIDGAGSAYETVNRLSDYLFDEENFRGNDDEYYDPRNSFLNDVIERRLGIPITLSLVYVEVGSRLGLPLAGAGMPGHFLVRYADPDEQIIIDPFHRGMILRDEDCAALMEGSTGYAGKFDRTLLEPVSRRAFLARMLNNLKAIYVNERDYARPLRR